MEITSQSTLFDVLEEYPYLETYIIDIASPLKNIRNPPLRRTVTKLATIKRVAEIGQVDVGIFVNHLRMAVGLPEISFREAEISDDQQQPMAEELDWITGEPKHIVNGTVLLLAGKIPLVTINELLASLAPKEFILLITNFEPLPIIDAMQKQNRQFFQRTTNQIPINYLTYIR